MVSSIPFTDHEHSTRTRTTLGLSGTTITNYDAFLNSMNEHHSTSGVPFSGTRVWVWTSVITAENGAIFTGYGIYDSNALTKAGFSITTRIITTTSCATATSTSQPLPPSPTGNNCAPHGDHCEFRNSIKQREGEMRCPISHLLSYSRCLLTRILI